MMRCSWCLAALLCVPAAAYCQDEQPDPAVESVRKVGAQVLELAQDDPRLDVAFHLSNTELTAERWGRSQASKTGWFT